MPVYRYSFGYVLERYPDTLEKVRGKKIPYALSPAGDSYFLRRFILHRDNYTCQCCGCRAQIPAHPKGLLVHHIKYQEVFDPDLLITLCDSCHAKLSCGK